MEQLYHLLDAFLAPGILVGLAVCLIFLYIPPKAALRNYRVARYVMGGAYLFYALCISLEYNVFNASESAALTQPIILFIACFQAFLFTYTMITLIRINYVPLQQVVMELTVIVVISVALFVLHLCYPGTVAQWASWIYMAFYIAMLVRYVLMFNREYRLYESQMDNFYSDEDTRRLYWVKRSFYISLAVGVLALLYALLPVTAVGIVFMAIVIVFYAAFGVRFINYVLHFQSIETAITASVDEASLDEDIDNEMMQRIDTLMTEEKLYRKSDLSVADIAERLGGRAREVSMVISACRQVNFKTYINDYRVVEAMRLLNEDKSNKRTIDAIASEAGFANRSSFYRVFKRSQGISPTDYRMSN